MLYRSSKANSVVFNACMHTRQPSDLASMSLSVGTRVYKYRGSYVSYSAARRGGDLRRLRSSWIEDVVTRIVEGWYGMSIPMLR